MTSTLTDTNYKKIDVDIFDNYVVASNKTYTN